MGLSFLGTRVPNNSKLITSHGNLVKYILVLILYHLLFRISKLLAAPFKHAVLDDHEDSPSDHHHQELSAPIIPVNFFAKSIKKQIPVMPYRSFLDKDRGKLVVDEEEDHKGCVCIVCLDQMEASHEVRVPLDCRHVFHRECLDSWVDQGQGTCPLCRSKLLPNYIQNHDQGDSMRRERMDFIFGEDYLFCE